MLSEQVDVVLIDGSLDGQEETFAGIAEIEFGILDRSEAHLKLPQFIENIECVIHRTRETGEFMGEKDVAAFFLRNGERSVQLRAVVFGA
jgi:hypothetical protein